MGLSPAQFLAMQARVQEAKAKGSPVVGVPEEREVGKGGLQGKIMDWCAAQWPRWKVDYARSDKRSTRPLGAHDFTVYAPGGRVLCVEVKAREEKVGKDQRVWHKELEVLGHRVHVVRTMEEWLAVAKPPAGAGDRSGIKPA